MVASGAPWFLRGPLAPYLGPQLASGGPGWALGLDWDPWQWHLERTHLPARVLVRIARKFATTTPHRQVRGPHRGPVELRVCIDTRCTPLTKPLRPNLSESRGVRPCLNELSARGNGFIPTIIIIAVTN